MKRCPARGEFTGGCVMPIVNGDARRGSTGIVVSSVFTTTRPTLFSTRTRAFAGNEAGRSVGTAKRPMNVVVETAVGPATGRSS